MSHQGMAIAVASSSTPHIIPPFRSHTIDLETIRGFTPPTSSVMITTTSTGQASGGYFGRYQGANRSNDGGRDMTDSTLSLEALAAILGPTSDPSEEDTGNVSPPARSRGYSAFRDDHPTPTRKAQSFPKINRLPTNQSPASHHRTRKSPVIRSRSVRFADTQGLPLEIVKPLTAADPFETEGEIVPSLSSDLGQVTLSPRPKQTTPTLTDKPSILKRVFKFTQPGTQPDFYQKIQTRKVCLESLRAEKRALHGIVRTLNLSFEKQVTIRWTHDKWQTFHDSICVYCQGSSDGHTDRFSFTIPVNGDDIEFAVCYRTQGTEYWDNNETLNYLVALEHQ